MKNKIIYLFALLLIVTSCGVPKDRTDFIKEQYKNYEETECGEICINDDCVDLGECEEDLHCIDNKCTKIDDDMDTAINDDTDDTENTGDDGDKIDAETDDFIFDNEPDEDIDIMTDEDINIPFCGNDIWEEGEICDGNSNTCSSLGIGTSGTAECEGDCSGWITSGVCQRTFTCSDKPENSEWNTVSEYTQTWSGSTWLPADSAASYDLSPTTTSCRYKCATNYSWNSSECTMFFKWTKQWGTSSSDYGRSVAVDSSGNIFVSGYTEGSLDGNTSAGVEDIFLTKWNADGTKAWTEQWGTTEKDYGESVAVDSSGNIFVAGITQGSLDGNANLDFLDIFLTKWNSDGTKAWTKQWGSTGNDKGYSVAVDSSGNIFVSGHTSGSLDGNANLGGFDIFLTKWNADGTKAWTKQWGTTGDDGCYSVAVDSSGNIFVTGNTNGSLDGNTNAGNQDIFLTKWNADGTKAWTKQFGTTDNDYGHSVAVDGSGNIFVSGYTSGSLEGNTNIGGLDIFLTKWSSTGIKAWTKQWGTTGTDNGNSVVIDSLGNIFVSGRIQGSLDGNTSFGGDDIFITKWNANGTKAWTKQWGTSSSDSGRSVTVDSSGNIFVTGETGDSLEGNIKVGNYDIFITNVMY